MNTDKQDTEGDLADLTERVRGAVFEVSNTLGAGFLEKVYERALLRELALRGIRTVRKLRSPSATRANPWGNTLPTSWWKMFW